MRIVLCALLGDREDVVGFADGDEARGSVGIVAVVVWVVLLGERVELALNLGSSGSGGQVQCFIVVD